MPLSIEFPDIIVEVQWLRIMQKSGHWSIGRHAHSSFEFHLIARGRCEVITDDGTFIAEPGTFYLTGPSVYHTQRSIGVEPLVEYSLDCTFKPQKDNGRGEWNELHLFFKNARCFPVKDAHGAIALFDKAIDEALSLQPGYPIMVHSLVLSILVSMGRSMGYVSSSFQSKSVSRMELIASYIEDNIYQQITPADIAAFLNLSEKQVSRIVLSSEGISTKRFITLAKIEEAKTLLAESDSPIGEIAQSLGFATASYFNTVFRNVEGVTPGAFRAQRR